MDDEPITGVEVECWFFRWARGELGSGGEQGGISRGKRIAVWVLAPNRESTCAVSSSWTPFVNSGKARTVNNKEKYSLRPRCRSSVSDGGRQLGTSSGPKADFIQPIIVVQIFARKISLYDIALLKLVNALNRDSQRSTAHGVLKSSKQARTSELEVNVVSGLPQWAARIS
jgi:hypothetical protein